MSSSANGTMVDQAQHVMHLLSQMKSLLQLEFLRTSIGHHVEHIVKDDELLLRWLDAHHDSPRSATLMLCENLYWRDAQGIDSILEENYLSLMGSKFPIHFGMYDNFGRPVIYVPLREWNFSEFTRLSSSGSGDFKRFVISIFEKVTLEIENRKKTQSASSDCESDPDSTFSISRNLTPMTLCKFSVIVNALGVKARTLLRWRVMRHMFLFSKTLESHYPGRLLRCIFVNCEDGLSETIFRFLMRPSFWRKCQTRPSTVPTSSTSTASKAKGNKILQLYGQHPTWQDILRSIIPSEELPTECGGWKKIQTQAVQIAEIRDEEMVMGETAKKYNESDSELLLNESCVP